MRRRRRANPSATCGFTATQLEAAYGLTPSLGNGSGVKVALIEAGDLSSAATDLSTYRTAYGLGTASFFKYNENGQQSNYPASCTNYGWCVETALDIDMVSASCPKCTIYLMEAKDQTSISDFEKAEAEAVTLGATIVSNSWSCPDNWDCGDTNFGNYFNNAGRRLSRLDRRLRLQQHRRPVGARQRDRRRRHPTP